MAHRENAVPFDRRNNVEAPASRLVHDFGHFRARPEELIECASAETGCRAAATRASGPAQSGSSSSSPTWRAPANGRTFGSITPFPTASPCARGPAAPQRAPRSGGGPARVLGRRRGYRLGSGRRMSCHREGASGPSQDRRTRDPGRRRILRASRWRLLASIGRDRDRHDEPVGGHSFRSDGGTCGRAGDGSRRQYWRDHCDLRSRPWIGTGHCRRGYC
jgi:hypothetical protein